MLILHPNTASKGSADMGGASLVTDHRENGTNPSTSPFWAGFRGSDCCHQCCGVDHVKLVKVINIYKPLMDFSTASPLTLLGSCHPKWKPHVSNQDARDHWVSRFTGTRGASAACPGNTLFVRYVKI